MLAAAEANCWVGARRLGAWRGSSESSAWSVGHCSASEEHRFAFAVPDNGLRYLNSGALIGTGRQLLGMFTAVESVVFADDQFLLMEAAARLRSCATLSGPCDGFQEANPSIVLDAHEEMFGSLLELTDCPLHARGFGQAGVEDGTDQIVTGLTCGPTPQIRSCCAKAAASQSWLHNFQPRRRQGRCVLSRGQSFGVKSGTRAAAAPLLWHGHGPGKALVFQLAAALLQCGAEVEGTRKRTQHLEPFMVEYWPFRLSCNTLHCPNHAELRALRSREPMWHTEARLDD